MSQLVIIGASAMGRETYVYAREAGMSVKGFLDSRTHLLDGYFGYPPILGSAEDYQIVADDVFVCAVGDPDMKMAYVDIINGKGGRFVSVIHPSAYVGMNSIVGDGCIIAPHATITNDVHIGDYVIVNVNVSISHDNKIGDGSTICPGSHLAGWITIGRNVFVGTGASLIPEVSLGDGVFVAAGAVVAKSFSSGKIKGVPARHFE